MRVPKFLTEKELNIIRGKILGNAATQAELLSVFTHYDLVEMRLDDADGEDMLGTEGWRHWVGLPD